MKIAILKCDEVLEELKLEHVSYTNMIRDMFSSILPKIDIEIFNCQLCHYPQDIDAFDFYITTGSRANAYDAEPWILQLIDFTRQLDLHRKKLIGICFGHQIIAMALNQSVKRSEKGWGVGIAEHRIVATPDWMSKKASSLNIIVSHRDQVVSIPPEATLIAESDFCPFFIVQWNDHFLSIQGHPEWNSDYSRALMNARRGIIPAERIEEGLSTLTRTTDNDLFIRWVIDFVKQ